MVGQPAGAVGGGLILGDRQAQGACWDSCISLSTLLDQHTGRVHSENTPAVPPGSKRAFSNYILPFSLLSPQILPVVSHRLQNVYS
jgi:hypothetical protein